MANPELEGVGVETQPLPPTPELAGCAVETELLTPQLFGVAIEVVEPEGGLRSGFQGAIGRRAIPEFGWHPVQG